jgi:hypothetical protein
MGAVRCLEDKEAEEDEDERDFVAVRAGVLMGMLTEAARGREEEEAEKMEAGGGQGGGKDPKAW